MRLLLDTVAFIRSVKAPELLSRNALAAMEHPDAILELSAITITEIAIKHTLGKLDLTEDDIRAAIRGFDFRLLPWKAEHAFRLFHVPRHHSDPFDRQLIAQVFSENIPVVTCDEKFRLYDGIQVIW